MLMEDQHPLNRSIVLSVLGAPNVGKSSLINYLLGTDLTVVTHKPQTTRNRFHCVLTIDRTEIVLIDTPGLHKSNQEFNKRLNEQAREGSDGADVNLLLIDLSREVLPQFVSFKEEFHREMGRTWIVFTKSDKIENASALPLGEVIEKVKEDLFPQIEKFFTISPKTGDNVHELTAAICDASVNGPHLYPRGEISNKNTRFFVTEYIREQAFSLLKDEIPYEIAVIIDDYKDEEATDEKEFSSKISASILVNRPSQRGIVVGSKGAMIKEIGTRSRAKIKSLVGHEVHLNLHVKVAPKWFKNNLILEELGLPRAKDSNRVWRQR